MKPLLSRFAVAFTSGVRGNVPSLYTPNVTLPKWGTLFFAPESASAVVAEGVELPILAAVSLSTKVQNLQSYAVREGDDLRIDPFASFITKNSNSKERAQSKNESIEIDMDRMATYSYRSGYLEGLHGYNNAPIILCDNGKFIDTEYKKEVVFPSEAILPGNPIANQVYKDYLVKRCNQLASGKENEAREYLKILTQSPEGLILAQDLREVAKHQKHDTHEYLRDLLELPKQQPSEKITPSNVAQFSQNPLTHQR